jgi:hypothetical protein
VDSADTLEDTVEHDAFRECVLNRFRNSANPPPEGGCAEVRIPMRFVPKRETDKKPPEAPDEPMDDESTQPK